MKILFCSPNPPVRELGAAKVLVELAEELEQLGWSCTIVGPLDMDSDCQGKNQHPDNYSNHLRAYLKQYAAWYDVVDYDHGHLPYSRTEFHSKPLFVARSVLLGHHFYPVPFPVSWKERTRFWLRGTTLEKQTQHNIKQAQLTIQEADLVNVSNCDDRTALMEVGIPAEKIVVLPFGLNQSLRSLFDVVSSEPPSQPRVVFIGTFDSRKGNKDFPAILQSICHAVPGVQFRLLGTTLTERKVLAHFPKRLADRIEVVPKYRADELPGLLASCSIGIFPSYIEGFAFGVLEMLAASIPVIAYNAPGAPMILPTEYLVSPGDTKSMSAKASDLLSHKAKLTTARVWAKQQSQKFCWQQIAEQTSKIYIEHWKKRLSN